jgi:hypothetical protein
MLKPEFHHFLDIEETGFDETLEIVDFFSSFDSIGIADKNHIGRFSASQNQNDDEERKSI